MKNGLLVGLSKRPDGGRAVRVMPIPELLELVSKGKAVRRNATLFYASKPAEQQYSTRDMSAQSKLQKGASRGRPARKRKPQSDTKN